tara:strand:- start:2678 stop:3820 length:1143 start_codon:yes stop_codon:yes gene_type:complete
MTAKITFFPVGNGDMTLIETSQGNRILIDCNIREGEDFPDVKRELRDRLVRDINGRLNVDLFIWTHPDADHCRGISKHFHLGRPEDWSKDKDLIFINEIWSSPIIFRRASKNHTLTEEAKIFKKEIKARVELYRKNYSTSAGNHVLILGPDEDSARNNDIPNIVMQLDSERSYFNNTFSAKLLGPSPKSEHDTDEESLGKNHSSVIMNYKVSCGSRSAQFLSGGDAEVVCWETLLKRLKQNGKESSLKYDILQSPHHCSWHSLSHDSLSKKGDEAATSPEAINALGKANENAIIIASSNTILDNDLDPPAYRAKKEYLAILDEVSGSFYCVADHKKDDENIPLTIEINSEKTRLLPAAGLASSSSANTSAVNRSGGTGYA